MDHRTSTTVTVVCPIHICDIYILTNIKQNMTNCRTIQDNARNKIEVLEADQQVPWVHFAAKTDGLEGAFKHSS